MRNDKVRKSLNESSDDSIIFANKYADLVVLINSILEEEGLNQKAFAERLGKNQSEITKWLTGEHNFTLRSICKLEAELKHTLIMIPKVYNNENVNENVNYNDNTEGQHFKPWEILRGEKKDTVLAEPQYKTAI